jgi:hypothetical protein
MPSDCSCFNCSTILKSDKKLKIGFDISRYHTLSNSEWYGLFSAVEAFDHFEL